MPTKTPYCASKGGLRRMMRSASVELAPHEITMSNIGPGAIFTPTDADVEKDAKLNDATLAEIPVSRWGKPDEVGLLAVYLASDDGLYVMGSTHFFDGGMLRNEGDL